MAYAFSHLCAVAGLIIIKVKITISSEQRIHATMGNATGVLSVLVETLAKIKIAKIMMAIPSIKGRQRRSQMRISIDVRPVVAENLASIKIANIMMAISSIMGLRRRSQMRISIDVRSVLDGILDNIKMAARGHKRY